MPRGQPDGGQWVDEGLSGEDRRRGNGETRIAQARGGGRGRPGGLPEMTPAQAARYEIAEALAKQALRRVRDRDPDWKPTPSLIETAEGAIRAREGELAEASARLRELLRDAIPNTNPDWGVNRLRKELIDRGFVLHRPARRGRGIILKNFSTKEEVRIMEVPTHRFRTDPPQKHLNSYFYRYRPEKDLAEGSHITILDKYE